MWRRPRNPHLKPNPMALEVSGSNWKPEKKIMSSNNQSLILPMSARYTDAESYYNKNKETIMLIASHK